MVCPSSNKLNEELCLTSGRHKLFLWFWNISIMTLSILLAITVFAQCTPVQSIWDSRVPSNGCSLNLTIMATIMCGMLRISPSIHHLPL